MPDVCCHSKTDAEQGFALIGALWLSLALGLVGAFSLALAWRAAVQAELVVQKVESTLSLDGAMVRALYDLGSASLAEPPAETSYTLNNRTVRMEARPAGAWPDINRIDAVSLAVVLEVLGASQDRAARLADTIADWREPAGLRRLNAATLEDYLAAGLPPPAHRPFETVSELERVAGLTRDEAACLAGHVTVASGSGSLDPAIAVHPALRTSVRSPSMPTAGQRWTLTAQTIDGAPAARSTFLLTLSPAEPLLVFQWNEAVTMHQRCFSS